MKSITLCLLLACCLSVYAQDSPGLRLHLQGYNILTPGFELAWEYPLLSRTKTTKKNKTRQYQILAAPVFETYFQKGNHTGLSVDGEVLLRLTAGKGHAFQVQSSVGLLRTFLHGTVYELDDNNNFVERKLAGNLHTQWKAGFAYGYDFSVQKEKPFSIQLRVGARRANMPASPVVPSVSLGATWYYSNHNERMRE